MAKLEKAGTSAHDGYIHGLVSVEFEGKELGLLSEDGLDWGGNKPTTVQIYSAQQPLAPVKSLVDRGGSDVISGYLINLRPEVLKHLFGGEVAGNKWTAPKSQTMREGAFAIRTQDGTTIADGKCTLLAKFEGKLKHNEVLKVYIELTILADGTKSPMSIDYGK